MIVGMNRALTLDTPIQYLKGVGPGLANVLAKLDIAIVNDLLYTFPRAYDDRREIPKIGKLPIGEVQMVLGQLISVTEEKKGKLSIIKGVLEQEGHYLTLVWFNQKWLMKVLRKAERLFAKGKVDINTYTHEPQMTGQEFEIIEDINDSLSVGRVVPVYGLTEGLSQKKIRSLTATALDKYLPLIEDRFSEDQRQQYQLASLSTALTNMHYPQGRNEWKRAHDRLVFEEFFRFYLRLFSIREELIREKGISFSLSNHLYQQYLRQIPFELTGAQQRVIAEIQQDMASPRVMNRLVQGDVGSGKTEVAIATILTAVENGYQTAIMAPTEILAEQHFRKMSKAFEVLGVSCRLLISNIKTAEKKALLDTIQKGESQVVIGTHALIQEHVQFRKLGLVVIDEQHRFGVKQRNELKQKGLNPDLLVMTATPIPRTLALTVYGDLDKSIIDEMPPGRKPVKTFFVRSGASPHAFIRQEVEKGQQAYIVYPLVEETEKSDLKAATESAEHFQKEIFPDFRIGLLHGQMAKEDKESVMKQFRDGNIQILVSTTVIEVGVDVSNASVMVIEEVERFGLSQLHQLRGRVGRGSQEATCFLVGNPKTEDARKRINAMCQTTDGFKIAEFDLQIRGPGEFLGTRQSGLPEFKVADLLKDEKILLRAKAAVEKMDVTEREHCLSVFFSNVQRQN